MTFSSTDSNISGNLCISSYLFLEKLLLKPFAWPSSILAAASANSTAGCSPWFSTTFILEISSTSSHCRSPYFQQHLTDHLAQYRIPRKVLSLTFGGQGGGSLFWRFLNPSNACNFFFLIFCSDHFFFLRGSFYSPKYFYLYLPLLVLCISNVK